MQYTTQSQRLIKQGRGKLGGKVSKGIDRLEEASTYNFNKRTPANEITDNEVLTDN